MKKILFIGMAVLLTACNLSTPQDTFHFDEMTYSPSETVFKLFAPTDASCFVVVDNDSIQMTLQTDSIWTATLKGDQKGKTYQFVVNGNTSPGVFAKAVTVNGEKGVIVDMDDTAPKGWKDDQHVLRPFQDNIIYEMHHRDFSIARPEAKHPGKFLALTEPWAIKHLQELGINAVHILPSYDYGSVDETQLDKPQYNWGYDPVNYNVPEGSYATDPYDPLCRIREFKQMVQALHKAGISVILDVVYNHTYDIDHSNFQRTYPDYYYRKVKEEYSNGSGCGNETASEQSMMRKFMMESVKYWINEYHIDGFRFDLMGVHDMETINAIRQMVDTINPDILVYGEGWSAGACALPNDQLAMKANIHQIPHVAAFSDEIRDALRGPFSDDTQGGWLANKADSEESLKFGIVGAIQHPQVDMTKVNYSKEAWASEPTQMISYVSCHDDMCLVDRLKTSIPSITEEELIRLDLLAQTAVFTAQGIPFMLSGEELLRDKKGVHNSFESPDSINHLEWTNLQHYPQVFEYYKNLIALRKHHPAFRLGSADLVRKHLSFLDTPEQMVAFQLKDLQGIDDWKHIIVILNASKTAQNLTIPQGHYTIVCQEGHINEHGLGAIHGQMVTIQPQSALILHE